MTPTELTRVILLRLEALYGDDYHRACGTAARIATEYGARHAEGWLVDGVGQWHMHHWAVLDGEIVDPLADEYEGPVSYYEER